MSYTIGITILAIVEAIAIVVILYGLPGMIVHIRLNLLADLKRRIRQARDEDADAQLHMLHMLLNSQVWE